MRCNLILRLATAAAVLICGTRALNAASGDYHIAPPGNDVAPYAVSKRKEPPLSHAALWRLLRQRIKYVFVIYQENRSFDSYFGTFPGADGLYTRTAAETPGFTQTLVNTDGSTGSIHPFRIGPVQFAADLDDIDHAHTMILAKLHVVGDKPLMDQFAITEERKYAPSGNPTLMAKQFGELAMAHEDCDTIPLLWRLANRFVLFDHIFQLMTGPSTLGNLSIIAAQTGVTQWALHPDQAYKGDGEKGAGVPVINDADPFWGSPDDKTAQKMPVNPRDFSGSHHYEIQRNLTFASLPLSLQGRSLSSTTAADGDPDDDLADVRKDIQAISRAGKRQVAFGWYEEGYDREPTDPGPADAEGLHASYVTHHNGPQYFGYVANNPKMRAQLHGLGDFFDAIDHAKLPAGGGLFYVKGGYRNAFGLKPVDPDPAVQKNFQGDDDHPAYSDSQVSEALVAQAINRIAASKYWKQSAIVVTWDDSEGDYDHVPPPVRAKGPDGSILSDGPRVPLLVISPYARTHFVAHAPGDHASVVKFADAVFGLIPLSDLPDETRGRALGLKQFGLSGLGPADTLADVTDLADAFDPARLSGRTPTLPAEYATTSENLIYTLPQAVGYGCKSIGVVPVDEALGIANEIPADFNPRPRTSTQR